LSNFKTQLRRLALSLSAGNWDRAAVTERLSRALDGGPPDPARLAARLFFLFDQGAHPSQSRLLDFLLQDKEIRQFWERSAGGFQVKLLLDPPVMGALPEGLITFPLPELATWKDLRLWLGLSNSELAWFADREGRQNRVSEAKLHHYRYRWLEKPLGGRRLLEIPKVRLKTMQRQILHALLDRVPAHPAAHGFRRHRSCLSYVTPHLGQAAVLRMDLQDFFHQVPVGRIGALFRRLGYPDNVARLLQGLCTHAASPILAGQAFGSLNWETRQRLHDKHLPQGAPSSPAIANLCAWRLDRRLQGVADRFGLVYTRYADDLAFSGSAELLSLTPFLRALVGKVALEEGFPVNQCKTRLQTRARSQRLAGIVINERPNLPRHEFDVLKATLYNCVRFGPDGQNRQQHADFRSYLAGRLAYASWLNPAKAERLQSLWRRIQWPV
jgi:hypothetical protein